MAEYFHHLANGADRAMILVDICSDRASFFLCYFTLFRYDSLLKHSWNNFANDLACSGAACFKTLAKTESSWQHVNSWFVCRTRWRKIDVDVKLPA